MACNRYCKSTLTAYTNTSTAVSAGQPIVFTNTQKQTGSSIAFTAGTPTINLNSAGLYYVSYSVTASANNTNVTAGIYRNGVLVPSTTKTATSTSNTNFVNIKDSVIIEVDNVCPCSGNGVSAIPLQLVMANDGTIANASITVFKLA